MKKYIYILVILVVIVVGLGAYFLWKRSNAPQAAPSVGPQSVSQVLSEVEKISGLPSAKPVKVKQDFGSTENLLDAQGFTFTAKLGAPEIQQKVDSTDEWLKNQGFTAQEFKQPESDSVGNRFIKYKKGSTECVLEKTDIESQDTSEVSFGCRELK
ncbi:MAG: hypothetical protein PHW01_03330 [Patescibacteria group bacterium]|nr:hypothetical protein [Patescibacteria group bacterium]